MHTWRHDVARPSGEAGAQQPLTTPTALHKNRMHLPLTRWRGQQSWDKSNTQLGATTDQAHIAAEAAEQTSCRQRQDTKRSDSTTPWHRAHTRRTTKSDELDDNSLVATGRNAIVKTHVPERHIHLTTRRIDGQRLLVGIVCPQTSENACPCVGSGMEIAT